METQALTGRTEELWMLTEDEKAAVRCLATMRFASLDECEDAIRRTYLPRWFVYRGGSHVAVHVRRDGRTHPARCLIFTVPAPMPANL